MFLSVFLFLTTLKEMLFSGKCLLWLTSEEFVVDEENNKVVFFVSSKFPTVLMKNQDFRATYENELGFPKSKLSAPSRIM